MPSTYAGPVGFGSDGVHYPLDDEGHLDTSRPLRWVEGGTYRDADEGEPSHADAHQANDVVVHPGQTVAAAPGEESYPVGTHVVSYEEGVYYLLDDETGVVHTDHPLVWDGETQSFRAAGGAA